MSIRYTTRCGECSFTLRRPTDNKFCSCCSSTTIRRALPTSNTRTPFFLQRLPGDLPPSLIHPPIHSPIKDSGIYAYLSVRTHVHQGPHSLTPVSLSLAALARYLALAHACYLCCVSHLYSVVPHIIDDPCICALNPADLLSARRLGPRRTCSGLHIIHF